jgi:DNA (cytosine-5)-methyltransferase 1
MRWLDLFSGIGGFALGLERAGHQTVAFCEIDPFCQRVLAKHWPEIPCYDDIRTLTAGRLAADGIIGMADPARIGCGCGPHAGREGAPDQPERCVWSEPSGSRIDGICGGFPCQDISTAGKGAGIEGARSGLWSEYARLIGELRPRYVFVENVAALLGRGLGRVLGDLAALGYDAEWHCIPASAVGAPHRRDRVWIAAYAAWLQPGWPEQRPERQRARQCSQSGDVADTHQSRLAIRSGVGGDAREERATAERNGWWLFEPDVGRVAHGIPARVDRLRSLGNAVVPQVVEMIGRAIGEHAS